MTLEDAAAEGLSVEEIATRENSEVAHGNSKLSTKPQYEIYDKETVDVSKTGISGQPLNKNGTSPRANN